MASMRWCASRGDEPKLVVLRHKFTNQEVELKSDLIPDFKSPSDLYIEANWSEVLAALCSSTITGSRPKLFLAGYFTEQEVQSNSHVASRGRPSPWGTSLGVIDRPSSKSRSDAPPSNIDHGKAKQEDDRDLEGTSTPKGEASPEVKSEMKQEPLMDIKEELGGGHDGKVSGITHGFSASSACSGQLDAALVGRHSGDASAQASSHEHDFDEGDVVPPPPAAEA